MKHSGWIFLLLLSCTTPPAVTEPVDEAFGLMNQRRADDAIRTLRACAKTHRGASRDACLSLLGRVHFYEEEWDEAASALDQWASFRVATAHQGGSPFLVAYNLFMAGYAHEQERRWEDAERRYAQAIDRWRKVQGDVPAAGTLLAASLLGQLRVTRRMGQPTQEVQRMLGAYVCAISGVETLGDGRLNNDRTLSPQIPTPRLLELARTCTDPPSRYRLLRQVIQQSKARAHEADLRRQARALLR